MALRQQDVAASGSTAHLVLGQTDIPPVLAQGSDGQLALLLDTSRPLPVPPSVSQPPILHGAQPPPPTQIRNGTQYSLQTIVTDSILDPHPRVQATHPATPVSPSHPSPEISKKQWLSSFLDKFLRKRNQQQHLARNQQPFDFFPLLGSALQVSLVGLVSLGTPPVILEAFSFRISEISPPGTGSTRLLVPARYSITCTYGPHVWPVTRSEHEFALLRAKIPLSEIRHHRSLKALPSFPSLSDLHTAEARSQAVCKYLTRLLRAINLTSLVYLCDFLSFSSLSFDRHFIAKPLEMPCSVRIYTPAMCGRTSSHSVRDGWILVSRENACIVILGAVDDATPRRVFFLDGPTLTVREHKPTVAGVQRPRVHLVFGANNHQHVSLQARSQADHKHLLDYCAQIATSSRFTVHPFGSFAPARANCHVETFVDGEGYFERVAEVVERAQRSIYIMDWFLTPEIYLKRKPGISGEEREKWRLDRLLKRKADEGVPVYVLVYKEVAAALTINSYHAKFSLLGLSPNIHVIRHPDISPKDPWWAHHSKLVVVDDIFTFIGGVDLCLGRFDTNDHPLFDFATPPLFPGQDYSNPTVKDFMNVDRAWADDLLDRTSTPRMPWHDIACLVVGNSDAARSFCQRWMFARRTKPTVFRAIPPLLPPPCEYAIGGTSPGGGVSPAAVLDLRRIEQVLGRKPDFSSPTQMCRSLAGWSGGVPTEQSIHQAYLTLIAEAKECVYIENQFFVSGFYAANRIGDALYQRILRAHQESQRFFVIVLMPLMPAFPGPLDTAAASTLRLILGYQYSSISRGPESLLGRLTAAGVPHEKYIGFYGLRKWEAIPAASQLEHLQRPRSSSTRSFARPRTNSTRVPATANGANGRPRSTSIRSPPATASAAPAISGPNGSTLPVSAETGRARVQSDDSPSLVAAGTVSTSRERTITIQSLAIPPLEVPVSVDGMAPTDLDPEVQLKTELVYIHSKLLIVDDECCLIGSANINDRSMLGNRDSEMAVILGPYTDRSHSQARDLRIRLMQEHLGLTDADPDTQLLLQSMSAADCIHLWRTTARANTQALADVFHCVPEDGVTSWAEYHAWMNSAPYADPDKVSELHAKLKREVKGHLVELPLKFLERENLLDFQLSPEGFLPAEVFI
ncbi:hypothetical protein BCR44DRAFT_34615 [Catenaria anguillulae PL171]|uniref:phospholipase D n=1 Tax=Catenaria anguillulae PL171 TaxID=765915 RepID=A0A1Y2HK55_9FUNG|nr:hypothetical protein BCR44DRAFT_34615 [Catenaria anguillulae PL171]